MSSAIRHDHSGIAAQQVNERQIDKAPMVHFDRMPKLRVMLDCPIGYVIRLIMPADKLPCHQHVPGPHREECLEAALHRI